MKKTAFILICFMVVLFSVEVTAGSASTFQSRKGIAYGNVLEQGWSCFYQWYKGRWGEEKYRRVIVDIRINRRGAVVVFSNNTERDLYNMAIINNVTTGNGGLANWKVARKNAKDTLILRNGKFVHAIIRGYRDHYYLFKGRKPIHRNDIRIVYPNPSIPLARRL